MVNLTFRQATNNDFPTLARIISTSEAWTCFGIDYNIALGLFEKMIDTIYIAEVDKQIVGFITLRIDGVGNIGAYVRMVAVEQSFRGQGIGRRLIDYVANIAYQEIPNLFLICSVENTDAQRFYENIGFMKVGVLSDLVVKGHDEILYRKTTGAMK